MLWIISAGLGNLSNTLVEGLPIHSRMVQLDILGKNIYLMAVGQGDAKALSEPGGTHRDIDPGGRKGFFPEFRIEGRRVPARFRRWPESEFRRSRI